MEPPNPEPQPEHHWLQRLVGEWTFECEFGMGPDEPRVNGAGSEIVRSLGGLWTIGEGTGGDIPDGPPQRSITTLGYDPRTKRFVGSFVSSCMTYLWIYDGTLDADRRVLTLRAEGPGFNPDGALSQFEDIHEIIDDDHRTLSSRIRGEDGSWFHFMTAHYRRAR